MVYCVVPYCRSKHGTTPGVHFHEFPSNQELYARWIAAISRENWRPNSNSNSSRVCHKHFLVSDYRQCGVRRCLIKGAVPSIFPDVPKRVQPGAKLEQDVSNYMQYRLMGRRKLQLRREVVPHKFECQGRRVPKARRTGEKRERKKIIAELLAAVELQATTTGKNGGSVSNPKDKSLSQHLSASDIKVEHGNVKKSKQSCSTAVQTPDSQNVSTSDVNEFRLINGNRLSNIDSYPQPTLNPTINQIKEEVPDCCEEILDSNKVAETVNTLSKDKREQASCFYKETESTLNLSAIQTESKTLDCNNVPARILYSSSIEIDQEATDSDNEAVQIQTLEVNSVAKDISMPQSELNTAFNQEINKEIPDSDGNAQTSAKFSCIGVDQNILQQCNRDIDCNFDLANIKIKEEILDFEEESEVDSSLISHDEIKKEILHSDYSSVPSTSSPSEQVILNNTKNTVRRSKRLAKNFNPPSKRKVSDKNCKMCQELNEKYEAEQMKCKDLEQKLKDADLKVLALMEKINRMSEEKMELQKKLSLQS